MKLQFKNMTYINIIMSVLIHESVNLLKCDYLLNNYTINDLFKHSNATNPKDVKSEYTTLMNYLLHKRKGYTSTEYNYVNGTTFGRLYGSLSIQNINCNIRNFLVENVTDIDMQNAFPTILMNICNDYGIHCVNLKNYVANRDEVLNDVQIEFAETRSDAKKRLLACMFYDKSIPLNNRCKVLKAFDQEMKFIQSEVIQIDDFKIIKSNKKQNYLGSFLSLLCQHYENIILGYMREYCQHNCIGVHSLLFDGMLVYGNVQDEQLEEMQKYIKTKSTWDISLCMKEIKTTLKLPEDYQPACIDDYNTVKKKFELTNCKVGDELVNFSPLKGNTIYNKKQFSFLNEELTYYDEIHNKNKSFLADWYLDYNKRCYECFDVFCKDELCPPGVFNLWKPFDVLEYEYSSDSRSLAEKGLEFFKNHLWIMAGEDQTIYNFLELWIAQMLQYPEHKSIELIFFSREGAGKGLFLDFFKTMLGHHKVFECTDPQNQIFGRFNSVMKDAFLVCMNETNKSYFYNNADRKKALITDPTIVIECKGQNSVVVNSFHRFIQFTNNIDPSPPSERRNCFIEMSNAKIDDTEYFNQGFVLAEDKDVAKAIYDYYMRYPTKPKINKNDIPISDYHTEIVLANKKPLISWLEEYAQEDNNSHFVSTKELLSKYKDWLESNGIKQEVNTRRLGLEFSSLKFKGLTHKQGYVGKVKSKGWGVNCELLMTDLKI